MSDRDDDVLRRYRALGREAPPASLDTAILAASRRFVRPSAVPRWAAPLSVAAVLVLALGLVLKVQREAPEAVMPAQSRVAPAAAPAVEAPSAPPTPAAAAPSVTPPAQRQEPGGPPEAKRVQAPARRGELVDAVPRAKVQSAPQAADVAAPRAADAAPAVESSQAAPSQPAAAPAPMLRSNAARAPAAATLEKPAVPDPLQRELERIARLRAEGKDDAADAALATFQRDHADYRIEPAMWDRVRRR